MLPLDRQNEYRRRYRLGRPGWRAGGDVFEQAVREAIRPSTRLLDLGGGRGGLIEILRGQVSAAATLDPDLPSLREHRAPAVGRVGGRAEALPFPAQAFDLVIATWLLEHLADPGAVFAEVHRVLRRADREPGTPGARFIFLTPNARHPLLMMNKLARALPALQRFLVPRLYARAEADTFPVRYRANTGPALHALCRRAGFALTLQHVADPTYTAFNEGLFRLSAFAEALLPTAFKIHLVGVAVKTT
jgi:SAM-dependent methyltransferase